MSDIPTIVYNERCTTGTSFGIEVLRFERTLKIKKISPALVACTPALGRKCKNKLSM